MNVGKALGIHMLPRTQNFGRKGGSDPVMREERFCETHLAKYLPILAFHRQQTSQFYVTRSESLREKKVVKKVEGQD